MKVAFDTSVLVAGLLEAHPRFDASSAWLDALASGRVQGFWSAHAFAETWSVLSRFPLVERMAAGEVRDVLEALASLCAPTPLTWEDYGAAVDRCVAAEQRSGAIFDALHLVAAEMSGAVALLTFNVRDFARLSPTIRIIDPGLEGPPSASAD